MKQQSNDQTKYSQEVEEILRKKPTFLVRKGILLLAILVALLLACAHFIKYPEQLTASVTFGTATGIDSTSFHGQIILTSAAASIVEVGQPVEMSLHTTFENSPVEISGKIDTIFPMAGGDYYTVLVLPDTTTLLPGYEGKAYIAIGEASLLEKILNPVFAVFRSADQ